MAVNSTPRTPLRISDTTNEAAGRENENIDANGHEIAHPNSGFKKRKPTMPSAGIEDEIVVESLNPEHHDGATLMKQVTTYYYQDPSLQTELEETKRKLKKVSEDYLNSAAANENLLHANKRLRIKIAEQAAEFAEREDSLQKTAAATKRQMETRILQDSHVLTTTRRLYCELEQQVLDLQTKCNNQQCPTASRLASLEAELRETQRKNEKIKAAAEELAKSAS